MDAVTYPHADVRAELEHWLERKVDITVDRDVAELFAVNAVPMAVAVSPDGRVLERIPNFVEPEVFRDALARLRRID
jgi:thioredoxin-related protein